MGEYVYLHNTTGIIKDCQNTGNYYPTALCRVQTMPKTSTNMQYLYFGSRLEVCLHGHVSLIIFTPCLYFVL